MHTTQEIDGLRNERESLRKQLRDKDDSRRRCDILRAKAAEVAVAAQRYDFVCVCMYLCMHLCVCVSVCMYLCMNDTPCLGRLEGKIRELEANKEHLEAQVREKDAVVARLVAKHRQAMTQMEPLAKELQELQIKHRCALMFGHAELRDNLEQITWGLCICTYTGFLHIIVTHLEMMMQGYAGQPPIGKYPCKIFRYVCIYVCNHAIVEV
jgi:hypothetical protein